MCAGAETEMGRGTALNVVTGNATGTRPEPTLAGIGTEIAIGRATAEIATGGTTPTGSGGTAIGAATEHWPGPQALHGRLRVKAYIYQIGKGSGDDMRKVAFSQELLADSLDEAIDKARAMTRTRPPDANEDTVHILDASQSDQQIIWARSAKDIRSA